MAFQIRRVAEAHNVPIFEHPQFARALYHTSEIGKEISPRLYVAVAQVLTYIYQLTGRTPKPRGPRAGQGKGPPKMPVLTIDRRPDEPSAARAGCAELRHERRGPSTTLGRRPPRARRTAARRRDARDGRRAAAAVAARRLLHFQHHAVARDPARRDLRAAAARFRGVPDGAARCHAAAARRSTSPRRASC